jgi:hypothetical protein
MIEPGHPARPRRKGDGLALWLAPVLLVVVALTQWLAAEVVPVSPWIGGGFGMFATVDGEDRVVTVDGIVVSSAASRDHAAAPTARSATALRQEFDRPGEVIVWAPRYESGSGLLTFDPIRVHPQP